jgi:hypothetical protein
MPIRPTRNEHIFRLHGIKYSRAFFKLVQQTLMLPDYFGGSWNALDDCMRDLSWLPEQEITLTFQGLPNVPQPLRTQIADSLELWRAYWHTQNGKTVIITF